MKTKNKCPDWLPTKNIKEDSEDWKMRACSACYQYKQCYQSTKT